MKPLLSLLLFSLSWVGLLQAQQPTDELKVKLEKLNKLEKKYFSTNYFLNKGFFFDQQIDKFKKGEKQEEEEPFIFNKPNLWVAHYRGLERSAFDKQLLDEYSVQDKLTNLLRNEQTVPIGVLQVSGEFLQAYELDEVIAAADNNLPMKKKYEKRDISSASVLRSTVSEAAVKFVFPEELFFLEDKDKKTTVEVSFGQGYMPVSPGDVFEINYESSGQKLVSVRFTNNKGSVVNHSQLNITSLKKEEPDFVIDVSTSTDGRSTNISGGYAEVFNGCDNNFDQPFIVVEGFDANNETTPQSLRRSLDRANVVFNLRQNGYDVVIVNFADGLASVENKSAVLEQVIGEVKQHRLGNTPITILGISMGGLVARHTLTSMEQRSIPTETNLFISFDSPFLGANVPMGYQSFLEHVEDVNMRQLFNIGQADIDQGNAILDSPAARQMLLRHRGVAPDPAYQQLQNTFASLGWPTTSRNIALINGSTTSEAQNANVNFAPGDRTFSAQGVAVGGFTFSAKMWTNELSNRNKVSELLVFWAGVPTTIKTGKYTFDQFNYDITSGGLIEANAPVERDEALQEQDWIVRFLHSVYTHYGLGVNDRPNFSFVPTFSSIAYTGPRDTQADLNQTLAAVQAAGQTPFAAVYGQPNNTEHAKSEDMTTPWNNLLTSEFSGYSAAGGGAACTFLMPGAIPGVSISGPSMFQCPDQTYTYQVTNDPLNNLYHYNWQLTRQSDGALIEQQQSTNAVFDFQLNGGQTGGYTVTVTKTFATTGGSSVGGSPTSSTSYSLILSSSFCGSSGWRITTLENEEMPTATLYPNPVDNELTAHFTTQTEGDVTLQVIPLNRLHRTTTLSKSERAAGSYTDTYQVHFLPPGLYLLKITGAGVAHEVKFIKQ
jgi:hypothetical protein